MLTHVIAGSAIASALGAAGGGVFANNIYGKFEKKSSAHGNGIKGKKSSISAERLSKMLAYLLPLALAGGVGAYTANKANKFYNYLTGDNSASYDKLLEVKNV